MKSQMSFSNLFILFAIFIILAFFYRRFEDKRIREEEKNDYEKIQEYLLDDKDSQVSLAKSKKPILWIHVPYMYNSRNWLSFGSRSSWDLNQPYLYLTVKSIIAKCNDSFRICIIDDSTFDKLIPDWNVDMTRISSPILDNYRSLGIVKLLSVYGGVVVPVSFLCMKDLVDLYTRGTSNGKMFICENINRNSTSVSVDFCPNMKFMGCEKNNVVMCRLVDFIERTIARDSSAESVFLGDFNRWIQKRVEERSVMLISGTEVGVKDMEDDPIVVEDLLSENYIQFYPNMYGIWIPAGDILKMRKYEWFTRLSVKQVLEANTMLSKYILVANAPENFSGAPGSGNNAGLITPLQANPDWVGFWMVPSQAPVWGLMPNAQYGGLGDNLIKVNQVPPNGT
jgi:hypothetical protein